MAYRAMMEVETNAAPAAAWHPWAQAALLFLALPVVAPALLWMRLAKSPWGKASIALSALSAIGLLAATTQVPRLAVIVAVGGVSTLALVMWRSSEGTLDSAPCLGLSRAVVFTMVAGGLLAAAGASAVLPLGALLHTTAIHRPATSVSTKQLAADSVAVPEHVVVREGRVDPGRAYYRLPGPPAWFERMPPEQRTDALEAWVPLEGTDDAVWVVFMGTNIVPMTAAIDGHLASVSPSDALAIAKAQGLVAPPTVAPHSKKHASQASSPPPPSVARVIYVGSTEAVATRTARTSETRLSFDWSWAWLLAIGLVLVAFGMSRSVEEARAV